MTDDNSVDKSFENEVPAPSPMVQISLKEYDKLKEQQHYITDKSLIDIIDIITLTTGLIMDENKQKALQLKWFLLVMEI